MVCARQETMTPLAAPEVNALWEQLKDHGVVLGKGGQFLNVSTDPYFSSNGEHN